MNALYADQLIFTRVEPDFSPQGKPGFQTVYKSDSLPPNEVEIIEKHVQRFQSNESEPIRHQFFVLNNSKVVLANTVKIETHPEITDKASRRGAFLVHCLILSLADFACIDYNPFPILDTYLFLSDPEEMVQRFGQATGRADPTQINVTESEESPPTSDWSGIEMLKLINLALQGKQLLKNGQSILLRGNEQYIREALKTVFWLIPKEDRLVCTFNTFIDGCAPQPGVYWAVGTSSRQSGSAYLQVDAAGRRVISQVQGTPDRKDLYLDWLTQACATQDSGVIMTQAPTMQELSRAFIKQSSLQEFPLDQIACETFMKLYENQFRQNLETTLMKMIGKNLTLLFIDYLTKTAEPSRLLNIAASQDPTSSDLSEDLVNWIADQKPDLQKSHLKDLQKVARQSENMHLLYLSAILSKKSDPKVRDEALATMNERTFEATLRLLMDPIPPADFVTPTHLPLLLSALAYKEMSEEQFVNLVEAIIKANATSCLTELTDHIKNLESKSLSKLEKFVKKQKSSDIPRQFERAMKARRQELG